MKTLFLALLLSFSVIASGGGEARSETFDHSHKSFDEILQARVSFKGNQSSVDYKGLKQSPEKLNTYLKSLSNVKRSSYNKFSSDEKLAFLINAYNAFTLKLIIKNYPVKSIKDIGSLFTSPWKKKFFKLFGKKFFLDKIEHGMIRKDFNEPRIHFAVNCASIGCPSLANNAFVADKLDEQLEKATLNFLNNKDKNYAKGNTLYLSKIFDWYGDDFKGLGGYKKFIMSKLNLTGKYGVSFLSYDWNLNKQ